MFTEYGAAPAAPVLFPDIWRQQTDADNARHKEESMKSAILLGQGWRFHLGDGKNFESPDFNDEEWESVSVPHDWDVELPPAEDAPAGPGGGYATGGIGWYRCRFSAPEDIDSLQNYLFFEGVYMDASVWLNGCRIGWNGYGYSSFRLDCGDALRAGDNLLAVRVDNSHLPNSRWYSGSGIFRDVWFIQTQKTAWDLFGVRCAVNGIYPASDSADLQIRGRVRNDSDTPVHAEIRYRLLDQDGNEVMSAGTALFLAAGESGDTMVRPVVKAPHLWTVEDPCLYTLESTVKTDGAGADTEYCRIGIRTASFDADRGFLLNGQPVKIKGMCVHHDCGLAGAVGYREIWERRLRKLKNMGCNGIRCAHNPPDPVLLDLCDELGFLVLDEIFDEWYLTKDKNSNYYSQSYAYGSSMFFSGHAEDELVSMIRRDFNHPSVILWSIGNEIPEQSAADGDRILTRLQDICHREDSTRMVTSACDNIHAPEPIRTRREFENDLDVVGYNYTGRWGTWGENFYEEDRSLYPQRRFLGTENPSAGGRRGCYTDQENSRDDYRTATMSYEALWRYEKSHAFVAGDYLWTGIDYLGEAEWPLRGSSSGALDTAGFEKDTYYFFRSIWNEDAVTLHLLPHWNWKGSEGKFLQVLCYTSCDAVRLYLNGRYVGLRISRCPRFGASKVWNERPEWIPTTNDLHLTWDVPFEAGELRAEGYIGDKLVIVEKVRTTGRPAALRAVSDTETLGVSEQPAQCFRQWIKPDVYQSGMRPHIAQIELTVLDEAGEEIPDVQPTIRCDVEGPAHLLGLDSGNLLDHTVYGSSCRQMQAGKLLAAVMADGTGRVRVRFHAEDLDVTDAVTDIVVV